MLITTVIIQVVSILILAAGGICLQIFLSKKESKWPGLILPIISFGISLFVLLGVLLFSAATGTTTLTANGEIVAQTVETIAEPISIVASAVYVFVLYNIPTAILLAIFAACRGKRNKKRAIEKMSIQDLE